MSTVSIKAISFDASAREIIAAQKAFDKVAVKTTNVVQVTMQKFCDAWLLANGKAEASCKAMGKSIRESEVVAKIVASGAMDKKTFTEYAQSAMRAVFHGIAWEAGLKNNPDYAMPSSKVSTPETKKAGKVIETTIESAHQTLQKAIAQYRKVNQTMLVAAMLDAVQEFYPEFKETQDAAL